MARGWESKDIESQQEQRTEERKPKAALTERDHQRHSLELTRKRVEGDLARATHPMHRYQIEDALKHLDAQIAALL